MVASAGRGRSGTRAPRYFLSINNLSVAVDKVDGEYLRLASWYEAGFEVLQPPTEISADHLRCFRPSAPRGHFVNNSTGKLSTHLSSSSSVSSSGSSLCFLNHNSSSRVPSARSVLVQVASSRLGFEPAMLTISRRPRRGPSEDQSRFSSLRIRRNMLNSGLFTGKRLSLNCVILLGSFRDSHVMRRCLIRRDENGRSLR